MEPIIPIYRPFITAADKQEVKKAIDSEWLTWYGQYVEKCTEKLKQLTRTKHVALLANGTVAGHCLFLALKHRYPRVKRIYVPNNVYVAAWNAALYEYTDLRVIPSTCNTWNVNLSALIYELESDQFIEECAVLIVHNVGRIVDWSIIKERFPQLPVVVDNCEGFGTTQGIEHTSEALCSSISFFANKTVTCGEGGAFCTNDADLFKYIVHVASQGMTEERYIHDTLAYNYRITNLQAALLYSQLRDFETVLGMKRVVFQWYHQFLEPVKHFIEFVDDYSQCSRWMMAIRFYSKTETYAQSKEFFDTRGIETRPFFYHIGRHSHLLQYAVRDESSTILGNELIIFPSFPTLTVEEIQRICDAIKEYLNLIN